MKKYLILVFSGIVGGIIGYMAGKIENVGSFGLITNTSFGAALFWLLGFFFFFQKTYSVILGPIVGLLISIGSDLLAGSEVVARTKMMYMCMGLVIFIILPFVRIWIPAGILGGAVGFAMGLNNDFWFGNSHLEPGLLLASLLTIRYAMVGMSVSTLFIGYGLIKYKDYFSRDFEKRRLAHEQRKRQERK